MHVVGHQDIGVNQHIVSICSLFQLLQLKRVIRITKEAHGTVITALYNMPRESFDNSRGILAIVCLYLFRAEVEISIASNLDISW